MKISQVFAAFFVGALMLSCGPAIEASSNEDAHVYFITPRDGETVKGSVTVKFGLYGMGVAPAGTDKANTGHHHLIIDAPLPPLDENIPLDENHLHFGGGQTETVIVLTPGTHTLQLLLGDKDHIPHTLPLFSHPITITVIE